MVEIKGILTEAVEKEASDVHINVGLRPIIRVNTELVETDFPTITDEDAKEILISLIANPPTFFNHGTIQKVNIDI